MSKKMLSAIIGETLFEFNEEIRGMVIISNSKEKKAKTSVPVRDILEFIGRYRRAKDIAYSLSMSGEEYLRYNSDTEPMRAGEFTEIMHFNIDD